MLSQLRAVKVLGWGPILRARQLKRLSDETIRGFYTTRTIIALFNIGLFDELTRRQTVNLGAFAVKNNLDLNILRILCDYLFSLKILNREGENYTIGPKGKTLIESLSGVFYTVYAYEDIFYHLESLLRKDKTYGVDITRRSEFVAKGSGAVGKLLAFPMVHEVLKRNGFERVLDLGCGDATFLIDQCERSDRVTGYGLDIAPEAIASGQRKLAEKNLQGRVQLFVGDIFKIDTLADQLQRIDAATSVYVLHEFLTDGNERLLEIFRRFRSAFPRVPLIICEVIRHAPEVLREKPGGVMEIQLFHNLSNQRLASQAEWQELFRQAGFKNINVDYLDFARTAIYTVS